MKKSSWCTTLQLGRACISLRVRVVLPPLVTLRREGPGRREAPRDTCARARPAAFPSPRPVLRARATAAAAPGGRGGRGGCVPRPRLGRAPAPASPTQAGGRPLPRAASPRPGPARGSHPPMPMMMFMARPAAARPDSCGLFLRGRGGMGTRRRRYRPPTCLSRDPGKGGEERGWRKRRR